MTTATTKTMTTTTTRTTRAAARRGLLSTTSSVLLLCMALLLTRSCGVSALSGDGESKAPAAVQLAVQPDEAIETTTLSEGSGWDQSTNEPEAETTTENAIDAETTAAPEAETTAAPEAETTAAPEAETTAAPEAETTLNPNEPEQETTLAPEEEQPTTTASPGAEEEQPTTINPNGEDEQPTTTDSPIAPTPPAPPPVFECQTPGLFAHISGDCQRFQNCLLNPLTGELLSLDMYCPPDTAFSASYRRCGRDVAACQDDDFVCLIPGHFAGNNDTYYYNCVINLKGGFHKYVVRCSGGERYEPLVRRCWRYDWSQLFPGQQSLESSDLAAIKREQKQFKAEEKLHLKELKNQEKLKRKQQKLEEKLAKKAAKEQAKKEAKANKPVSVESAESPEQSSNEI